jgi:hypothetical protein
MKNFELNCEKKNYFKKDKEDIFPGLVDNALKLKNIY